MKWYTKTIGPEEAMTLLENNGANRKVSLSGVEFLTKEMLRGNFKNNGDVIRISNTGALLDGQHRLHAIIASKKRLDLNFCEGLDDDCFDVIDVGKKRDAADILSAIGNRSHPFELAAATRILFSIETKGSFNSSDRYPNSDIIKYVQTHPELSDTVSYVYKENKKFRMISASVAAALYYLFINKHNEQGQDFFQKFWTGIDLHKNHPIWMLRDKLIRNSVAKTKIKQVDKMKLVIIAWNHFRKNKDVTKLDFDKDTFPKII